MQSGGDAVRIYDTLDHAIGGVQQQQGGQPGRLSFTSQRGTFTVESLPLASLDNSTVPPGPAAESASAGRTAASPPPAGAPEQAARAGTDADAGLAVFERPADLHRRGVLTDEEFAVNNAEVLSRLQTSRRLSAGLVQVNRGLGSARVASSASVR